MTIYIDVLLAVNLYINYFIVRGTAFFLRKKLSLRRCLAAAMVGALFSLVVLVPEMPFAASTIIKVLSAGAVVFVAFRSDNAADIVLSALMFLVISFAYAGSMLALWVFLAPHGMYYRNGVAYFDVPLIFVSLITILGYWIVIVVRYLTDRCGTSTISADITLKKDMVTVSLKGVADTGNRLIDPFSGKPVIVCSTDSVSAIIPENVRQYLAGEVDKIDGIRLVPCDTIAGHAIVPVFTAEVSINGMKTDAMIGVTSHSIGVDCVFNPNLISF